MPTRSEDFAGLSVAITTPFRDGQVDIEALQRQVEFQIAAGTNCICPVGTTGECPTLSHAEHERVIAAVVEAAAGRIKVMAGTGSNSTDEALRLTALRPRAGPTRRLVVAPYYNKPTQEGFYQHFKALAEAVDIPICVYNIPGRTGKNIEPETIARMAELPNITMVKEATGSMDQASQILGRHRLDRAQRRRQPDVAAAGDRRAGRDLGRGQHRARRRDRHAPGLRCGKMAEARHWHQKLFPLCRDMLGLATNPIPIKAAMQLLGRDTGELRMPMTPLDAADEAKLRNDAGRLRAALTGGH